jgi:hypothetical protein
VHEDGVQAAVGNPALRQRAVFAGHHEGATADARRQLAVRHEFDRRGGDEADRVHLGVEQLHERGRRAELGDPVRTGEPDVPGARAQHLHDALGFEDLGLDARQRDVRAIAAAAGPQPDARVGHEGRHTVLHSSFGQREFQQGGLRGRGRGAQRFLAAGRAG